MDSYHMYRIKYAEEAKQKGSVAYSDWLRKDVGLVTDDLVLSKVFNNQYKSWADYLKRRCLMSV